MDTMAPSIEEGLGLAQSDEDEPSRKEIGEGRERLTQDERMSALSAVPYDTDIESDMYF